MITDIEEGEQLVTHDPAANERLLIRLGLASSRKGTRRKQEESEGETSKGTSGQKPTTSVGQRSPNRDPVKDGRAAHG